MHIPSPSPSPSLYPSHYTLWLTWHKSVKSLPLTAFTGSHTDWYTLEFMLCVFQRLYIKVTSYIHDSFWIQKIVSLSYTGAHRGPEVDTWTTSCYTFDVMREYDEMKSAVQLPSSVFVALQWSSPILSIMPPSTDISALMYSNHISGFVVPYSSIPASNNLRSLCMHGSS